MRLGREQIETAYVIKQILDAGVRLFYRKVVRTIPRVAGKLI